MNAQQVMSPEDIKREKELQDNLAALANSRRKEEVKQLWHGFGKVVPFGITFVVLCVLGVIFFGTFRIMADSWSATHWVQ